MMDPVNVPPLPMRGEPWSARDRTGGPIDLVPTRNASVLRVEGPVVERLAVTHAGDDDSVYFLGIADRIDLAQVDTGANGEPPFLIESAERYETSDLRPQTPPRQ
jgi:hypothetical protein